jgi:flagellar motility protein MotE (MotC chaperone)
MVAINGLFLVPKMEKALMSARLKLSVGSFLSAAIACSWAVAQTPVPTQQPTPAVAPTIDPITRPFQVQVGGFGGGSKDPQASKLAKQYVTAEKEDQKKEIRKRLTDSLAKQFDQHVQQQQKELENLEKQIASLRTVLKKRQDSKTSIVERRVEQLILEADGMGWNVPSTPSAPRAGMGVGKGVGAAQDKK